MNKRKNENISSGFTLIEMMVVLAVGTLFIGWAYSAYIIHHKTYTTESQITEMQYASGVSMDIIEKDIRESGFGIPDSPNIFGYTASLTVNDSGTDGGPDSIDLLGAYTRVATLNGSLDPGINTITVNWNAGFDPVATPPQYLSIDGLSFFSVNAISGNVVTLLSNVDRYYPSGRILYSVDVISYFIAGNILYRSASTSSSPNDFNGDGFGDEPVAFNIDDLQFATEDIDGDTVADRVRVSILARTERQIKKGIRSTAPITLENNTTTTNDFYRRRTYKVDLGLRNPLKF